MKYQVVVQFDHESLSDFDDLIRMENHLLHRLGNLAVVDGHDFGSREANIFLDSEHPQLLVRALLNLCTEGIIDDSLRVGCREEGDDSYNLLHPVDGGKFIVK